MRPADPRTNVLLFAYGTLLDERVQRRLLGRAVSGTPDRLEGYRKSVLTQDGQSYPVALADKGKAITGRALKIAESDLEILDDYEGPEYRRIRARLASGCECWVYVAVESG